MRCLQLQEQNAGIRDHRAFVRGELRQHPVRPGVDDDRVLAPVVHGDDRGAGGRIHPPQVQCDPALHEARDEAVAGGIRAERSDEGCVGTRPGRCRHLVVAFAAGRRVRRGREHGLPGRRDPLDTIDEVEVGAPDHDDTHGATIARLRPAFGRGRPRTGRRRRGTCSGRAARDGLRRCTRPRAR